jgi:hypothetical protein
MVENTEPTNPNSGKFILEQLQRCGSVVTRTHEVTFWLYFPTRKLAEQAGQRAEEAGLKPEISPPLKDVSDPKWLCLLYCPHIPDESILDGISDFCEELAADFDGKFDGWEAGLELEPGVDPVARMRESS